MLDKYIQYRLVADCTPLGGMMDTSLLCLFALFGRLLSVISAASNGSFYKFRYCEQFISKTLVAADATSSIHCGALCEMQNCSKFQYNSKDAKCYTGASTVATSTNFDGMMVNIYSMSSCPSKYDHIPFTDMCIRLSTDQKTWLDANSECKGQGANLVSIPCSYVGNYLYDYRVSKGIGHEEVWIGINDKTVEGKFVWSNGQPVTYTNWVPPQPDNFLGTQDFGMLIGNSKGWDDGNYSTKKYYICSTYI